MTFTLSSSRTLALGLCTLAAISLAGHVLLSIDLAHVALGFLAAAPLWCLATLAAARRELTFGSAIGVGIGLAGTTIAATGVTDIAAASVLFLVAAGVEVLAIDCGAARVASTVSPEPFGRTGILMARASDAANDLRLVR